MFIEYYTCKDNLCDVTSVLLSVMCCGGRIGWHLVCIVFENQDGWMFCEVSVEIQFICNETLSLFLVRALVKWICNYISPVNLFQLLLLQS